MRRCACWQCRRRGGLAVIAPRLTVAYHQIQADHRARARVRKRLLREEMILAHRELQLVRAGHSRNRDYIGKRQRKLASSLRIVAELRKKLEAIG